MQDSAIEVSVVYINERIGASIAEIRDYKNKEGFEKAMEEFLLPLFQAEKELNQDDGYHRRLLRQCIHEALYFKEMVMFLGSGYLHVEMLQRG